MSQWGSTFVIISPDGQDYLTDKGKDVLKNGDSYDIRKLFYMNAYDEEISEKLKTNDIVKAPQWKKWTENGKFINSKDCKWDLYKFSKGEFRKIKQYEASDKNIVKFELSEWSWFKINNTMYFASQTLEKIAKLSVYWTDVGQTFLLNRRKEYLFVRDNIEFGPNQVKAYKRIPNKWTEQVKIIPKQMK